MQLEKGNAAKAADVAKDESWYPVEDIYQNVASDINYPKIQESIRTRASEKLKDPMSADLGSSMNKFADKLEPYAESSAGGNIPLETLRGQKSKLQKAYEFSGLEPGASKQVQQELGKVYRSEIGDSVERKLGKEARIGFDDLNEKYGLLAEIAKKQAVNAQKKSATFTPSDIGFGTAGAVIGGLSGGFLGSGLGGAAGYFVKKFARDYGDKLKAIGYDKASKKLQQIAAKPEEFTKYMFNYPTLDLLINALEGE